MNFKQIFKSQVAVIPVPANSFARPCTRTVDAIFVIEYGVFPLKNLPKDLKMLNNLIYLKKYCD